MMTKGNGTHNGSKSKSEKGTGLTEKCVNYSMRCCRFHLTLVMSKLVLLTLRNEVDSIYSPKQSQEETDAYDPHKEKDKINQGLKAINKPHGGSMPRTHLVEGKKSLLHVMFQSLLACCVIYVHTYPSIHKTHIDNK